MPQEIYNEGRVVGLSAWELFVKTALANGVPEASIPNEAQWLTSMIGIGSSMILRIPANTSAGVHDYVLPAGSNLTAAGVIIANPFQGTCEWDSSTWATKVTSYGSLIQNSSTNAPSADGSSVPYDNNYDGTEFANCVTEFVKLTEGIVFTKNATWIPTDPAKQDADGQPNKDINPNFNESTTIVRIYINKTTVYDMSILLTGFANKRILQGLSGYAGEDSGISVGGSTDTTYNDWINGGMLGPEIIPWASKIIFTVPSSAYNLANTLARKVPSDADWDEVTTIDDITFNLPDTTVRTNSLIDFSAINLTDYYNKHSSEFSATPTIQETVSAVSLGINDSYNTVFAWYPGMTTSKIDAAVDDSDIFPPALYAAKVTTTGSQTLVPLDTAAPGTVKGFEDPTQAYHYKTLLPDNYAIYHNTTTNTFSFVINGQSDPDAWSGTAKITYTTEPVVNITAGSDSVDLIALTDSNGDSYATDGQDGDSLTSSKGKFAWGDLLGVLSANECVDVLGTKFRNFGDELDDDNTIGITNSIDQIGSAKFTITGSNPVSITSSVNKTTKLATLDSGTSFKSGTNFIEFSNGLRLYISNTNPGTTNVPTNSIGIGW